MAVTDNWIKAFPLHENHPDFLAQAEASTQNTQSEGPFYYTITNKGVLRFGRPLAAGSLLEIQYTYNPVDLEVDTITPAYTVPDLPSGYEEVILDVAARNMFSAPGDDARATQWAEIAKDSVASLLAAIKYRQDNQAQREAKRQRWVLSPDGQLTMVLDHLEGPSQPTEGVKTV